jgi:hypothetical protein
MGSLPDPAQAASRAATAVAGVGPTVGAPPPGAATRAPVRVASFLVTGQVLTGATPGTVPTAAVQRCRTDILAGKAAARAGAASYRDWSRHVQAQLDLDTGRTTWLGAVRLWTATRSAGSGDQQGFAMAVRRRAATAGACGVLAAQTSGALHQAATGCQVRSVALDRVIGAGGRVTADWARHLATTTSEAAHAPGGPQARAWLVTARAAPAVLAQFRQAQAVAGAAPACRL